VVYISSIGSGTVYALDAKTGVVVWSKQIMPSYLTAPTVVNGVVYVGTFNFGGIFALSASTGALLWNSTALDSDWGVPEWIAPHSGVDSPPTVVKGVVYFGSEDGLTYAFDASSRRMLWSINSTDGSVYSSPVVTGGVVYVTVCDFAGPRNEGSGLVYAIDASTGALIWNVTVAPLQNEYPVVVGGVVYVSGYDGNIYALNAANGHQVWSYTAGNYVEYKSYVGEFALSTPNVVNGVVYLNSMDENVYALNAAHGYLLWSYTVGGGIDSAPAVTDGIVYLGSENGNVYALSLSASTSTPTSPTTTPLSTQEPLTAGLVALSGTVAAVLVAAGLLAYFKKRKGETPNLKQ
jgi:serine/threonine-protein kinase